jgi:hypothetical protein
MQQGASLPAVCVWALVAAGASLASAEGNPTHGAPSIGPVAATVDKAIVVGDPCSSPPVTPADRVDENVPSSPFAGVVSINPISDDGSYLCSGVVISDRHILTAGHCADDDDDGQANLDLAQTRIVFNHQASPVIYTGIDAVDLHPDYTGFNNPAINDDIAVITLGEPIPAGVPIYPMVDEPFVHVEGIIMAGYGRSGNGVTGDTVGASFFVKRTGQNLVTRAQLDDEGSGLLEVFAYDFDGPDANTDAYGDGNSLGNFFETTIAPGDSGGPSFLWDDDGDAVLEIDELTVFGINTFSGSTGEGPDAPLFGSVAGGMAVASYRPFIDEIVPEPTALSLLAGGMMAMLRRRRSARR